MEKEFIPYEQALALKELGFDEPCFGYYYTTNGKDWQFAEKSEYYRLDDEINIGSKFSLLAPTYSQAFRWFEDNHQLYPAVVIDQTSYPKYAFEIASFFGNPKDLTEKEWGWNEMVFSRSLYRTKTEAESACLDKLIEIVKQK